jgi:Tfp pilus assembly protein PilF
MYRFSLTILLVPPLLVVRLSTAVADDQATCSDANSPPDPAIAACSRLISSGRITTGVALSSIYRSRAHQYVQKDVYDRALADLDQAVQLNAKDAISFSMRGTIYLLQRDYDHALPDLNRAIQINPNDVGSLTFRAVVFNHQQAWDQALSDLNKAVRLNPKGELAYRIRGFSHEGKDELEQAREDFRKALSIDPRDDLAADGAKRVEEKIAKK